MIIGLEGFGNVWSPRNGAVTERTAFYNTTGIVLDGKLRHRSRVFGQVRFNAIGGFNPQHIEANIGRVFESAGFRDGSSSCLLLHHLLSRPFQPDYYLFRVISEDTGILEVDRAGWKSDAVALLSLSQMRRTDSHSRNNCDQIQQQSGRIGVLAAFFANGRQALRHALSTYGVLLSPELPLTRRQHEMIATLVSALNRCFY